MKRLIMKFSAVSLSVFNLVFLSSSKIPVQAQISLDSGGLCTIDTGRQRQSFSCYYDYGTGTGLTYMTFYREGEGAIDESDKFGTFLTIMSTEPHRKLFIWPDGTEEPIRGFRRYNEGSSFTFWLERGWAITFEYPD